MPPAVTGSQVALYPQTDPAVCVAGRFAGLGQPTPENPAALRSVGCRRLPLSTAIPLAHRLD